jgi:hypothetical protein
LTKFIIGLRIGGFQIALLTPGAPATSKHVGGSGIASDIVRNAIDTHRAAVLVISSNHDGVAIYGDTSAKEVIGIRIGGFQIGLLGPGASGTGKHIGGPRIEGIVIRRVAIDTAGVAILKPGADRERVAIHRYAPTKEVGSPRICSFEIGLLGPGRATADKHIGRPGKGRILVGHAVDPSGATVLKKGADHDRIPAHANTAAKGVRKVGIRCFKIGLLGPGRVTADKHIGCPGIGHILVGRAIDAGRTAILIGRADHHGVATDSHTPAKAITRSGIGGFEVRLLGPGGTAADKHIRGPGIRRILVGRAIDAGRTAILVECPHHDGVTTDRHPPTEVVICSSGGRFEVRLRDGQATRHACSGWKLNLNGLPVGSRKRGWTARGMEGCRERGGDYDQYQRHQEDAKEQTTGTMATSGRWILRRTMHTEFLIARTAGRAAKAAIIGGLVGTDRALRRRAAPQASTDESEDTLPMLRGCYTRRARSSLSPESACCTTATC